MTVNQLIRKLKNDPTFKVTIVASRGARSNHADI
jgi:hypothetical protein